MANNLIFTNVIYDPGMLQAEWLATVPPRFTGYQVVLAASDGTAQTFMQTLPSITIAQTLDPAKSYTLTVTVMVNGQPTSQTATITVINTAPVVSLVDNSGTALMLQWGPAPGAGVTGYLAQLIEVFHQSWTSSTDAATFTTTFPVPLDPALGYTVNVRASGADGVVLGPTSQVLAPITTAPTITIASNDITESNLWWAPAPGPGIGGYAANLLQVGSSSSWQYTGPDVTHAVFVQQLDPVYEYTVVVRATDDALIVFGPPSQVLTMITGAPTTTLVDNGGQSVYMQWAPATGGPIDGYVALLVETGVQQWTQSTDASTPHVQFAQQLSVDANYTISVRATNTGAIVLGPPGQVLTPIAGAPAITLVDNQGPQVVYDWTPAPGAGVDGYLALLTQTGGSVWTESTGKDTLVAVFSQQLAATHTYTSAVRATNTDAVVLGPPSDVLAPITTTPQGTIVSTTGTQILVGWIADTNPLVTSYVADLFKDSVSQGAQPLQGPPAIYEQQLAAGSIYSGVTRSAGDRVLGPWSTKAIGPYAMNSTYVYDAFGRMKTVTWNASTTMAYTYDDAGNLELIAVSNS